MDPHQFIKKEWVVSTAARRIFRAAAALSLTLYVSLGWVLVNGGTPLLRQLVFVGVLSMAFTAAGMEAFLFLYDDSPAWKQISWFVLMIFAPLGPALYCFIIYSRSTTVREACTPRQDAVLNGMNR